MPKSLRPLLTATAAALALLLAACGQTGPLKLPPTAKPAAKEVADPAAAPAQPAPAPIS